MRDFLNYHPPTGPLWTLANLLLFGGIALDFVLHPKWVGATLAGVGLLLNVLLLLIEGRKRKRR